MDNNVTKEELDNYQKTHSINECSAHFNVSVRKLRQLLKDFGIKKTKQSSSKGTFTINNGEIIKRIKIGSPIPEGWSEGGLSFRDHTSYVESGKLSAETQKSRKDKHELGIIEKYGSLENYYKLRSDRSLEKKILLNGSLEESYKKGVKTLQDNAIKKYGSLDKYYSKMVETTREHNLKKYGVEYSFQRQEVRDKASETNKLKYGVPWYCMTDECRSYSSNNSGPNKAFEDLLNANSIEYIREFPLDNYSFDFKVENILIEIDPSATHNSTFSPFKRDPLDKNYHTKKSKVANDAGYRCIHVFDWDNIDAILSLIKHRDSISARKCDVREVSKEDAKEFIFKNHVQGYANDSIRLGLYYNDSLVSIMTFGRPRYNKNYDYELIRYCSSLNITGGAEKLFKHFIREHDKSSIISYCDMSKFNGDTYKKLGFSLLKSHGPSAHWYNMKSHRHITDNLLRQRGFDQLFNTNYGKGTSNSELMIENGFVKIFDCGQSVYEFRGY